MAELNAASWSSDQTGFPDARGSAADGALWLAGQALALLVATVGAAVVAGLWDWTADGGRRVVSRGRPDSPGPPPTSPTSSRR